jgi:tetratricopeptide (TPR) repeat protein
MASEAAREHLRRAHALHAERRTDEALAEARQALEVNPDYVEGLTYYGTTLITRQLAYREGLEALERAVALEPENAGAWYSLGWCEEFVAYRLEKQATTPYRDPYELYERAAEHLQRCIDLDPEAGLKEDAKDLLESIQQRLEVGN